MKGFFRLGMAIFLLCLIKMPLVFGGIIFSNRSSSMVVLPSGKIYLGQTDSIKGWSRESIVQAVGNNSPFDWDPSWTGENVVTYATAPVPDLPKNPGDITLNVYYHELTEDLFLGPNRNLIIEPSENSDYTFINGNGYAINLAEGYQNLIRIAPGQTVEIGNAVIKNYDEFGIYFGLGSSLSFLNSSIEITDNRTFSKPLNLSGEVSINGYGYTVILNSSSGINVTTGQLSVNNLTLYGVQGQNVRSLNDSCNIILQNCNMFLTDDYRFKFGGLQMIDSKISGFHGFNYESSLTCSISRTVMLDTGVTFSYSPTTTNRDLIYMDGSSRLYLNGCTLSSSLTGMRLTTGTVIVDGQNKIYNDGALSASQAVMFGSGDLSKDLGIEILPGAKLELMSGIFVYANVG